MAIKEADRDGLLKVKNWPEPYRIEQQTCRPIIDGKPSPPIHNVLNFLFYVDNMTDPIGSIFYFNVNERNRSCELGYKINPDYRNKGYGKKMVQEFISHLFTTKDFNKLYCQTASFNKPSVKMLERLGFKRDGILREHHELDGKFYDDYVYSILLSEWYRQS